MPQELIMSRRPSAALLLSASLVALSCGQARAQGFLIEPPGVRDERRAPAANNAAAAPAASPNTPVPQAAAQKPVMAPVEGGKDGPDETALRYYAAQNQAIRVTTEAARLQRLHPDWTPPANLYDRVDASGEDEQAMWDLFGADRLDELRSAIVMRQRAEPGWKPSAELLDKMARKATRQRLITLWNDGRLGDIVESVRAEGYGGADADVDLRWTVAEVYARMKQTSEAIAVYQSILASSADRNERLATIQKAMDSLRISDVEPLIAQGRIEAGGRSEFAPLAIDITRARIAAYLHDERAEPVPAHEFQAFEAYARGVKDANQAGLVAWHHYKAKAFQEALDWFKLALERGGDAMIAHGLAHALRELGLSREAEEVAYAWREPLINNAILFIDMLERELTRQTPGYIEPERLLRYAQVTMDLASGEGAQALGWYAYNTCQFEAAHEWFQRAGAWFPKETTVVGLALSARRLKKQKDVFELANRYDGLFPKLIELIFPDNIARPPQACDILAGAGARKPGAAVVAAAKPAAPAWTPPATVGAAGARHPGWTHPASRPAAAPVAGWSQPAWTPAATLAVERMPRFAKGEFPNAVDPGNPLRFGSTGKLFGQPAPSAVPPAGQTPLAAEPWRQAPPLVARRTPGVGPMPYERWGFSLLPAGNGLQTADAPHSAQAAPAGTLWAAEQATGTLANRPGPEGVDPFVMMQAIAGAARVPLPGAVRPAATGPVYLRSSHGPGVDQLFGVAALRPSLSGADDAAAAQDVDRQTVSSIARADPPPEREDEDQDETVAAAFPVSDDLGLRAVGLYEAKQYVAAIEALDLRATIAPETADLQLVRGWSLLNLARTEEARRVFVQLPDAPKGAAPAIPDRRR